jgi:hypothetical protein
MEDAAGAAARYPIEPGEESGPLADGKRKR